MSHGFKKLHFLIFFKNLNILEYFLEVKFANFIVWFLEETLILLKFSAQKLRKLNGQIFKALELICVLYKKVKLKRNNLFSHHTMPKIATNDKSFSLEYILMCKSFQQLAKIFNNFWIVIFKFFSHSIIW